MSVEIEDGGDFSDDNIERDVDGGQLLVVETCGVGLRACVASTRLWSGVDSRQCAHKRV